MVQKVKRDTLSEQVARGLLDFIEERSLMPGDSLPSESQLAAEFGVSRPVIREALRTLQGQGLIEIITGKNAVIKPVSSVILRQFFERATTLKAATFRDLIEVRRGLEIQSAMLAAERCTAEDVAKMNAIIDKMQKSIKDHVIFAEYDVELHLTIALASQNPVLFHLIESIRDAMRDNVLHGLKHRFTDEEYENVQSRHEAIVAALAKHDPEQAQRAMQEHFDEALKALLHDA